MRYYILIFLLFSSSIYANNVIHIKVDENSNPKCNLGVRFNIYRANDNLYLIPYKKIKLLIGESESINLPDNWILGAQVIPVPLNGWANRNFIKQVEFNKVLRLKLVSVNDRLDGKVTCVGWGVID